MSEMAGDWIKMRVDLQDDPAVLAIADSLEMDEFSVIGRLHRLWGWADKHTIDGTSKAVTLKWVDKYVQKSGFAEAMISAGWLAYNDGALSFPKFDIHNGKSAKSRCDAALRQRQSRERLAGVTNGGDKRVTIPKPFVAAVMKRDNYQCVYCGTESTEAKEKHGKAKLSVDHIIPHSRGDGRQAIEDLATCCKLCNKEKNDRTPEEWGILPEFLQTGVSYKNGMLVTDACDSSVTDALLDKRREDKSNTNTEKPSRTANVFVAPSVSEVAEYVKEIGAVVDALDFVNYYTSNGWMVGRSKMKDWKAAVRTWNSKRLKPDDQYDEDPKFMRLLRIATQKGTSNECDVEWRRNNMSQEERDAVRVNCIRFETLADAKLHPLERKRIAKLYITTLRGMESLKNG